MHIAGKLNNPDFIQRAPDAVVQKERARYETVQKTLEKFTQRLTAHS